MKNRKTINWISLLTLLVVGFASASLGQTKQVPKTTEKPLPNLLLNTIDGQKWNLYENRGRVVLINFWATWCAPCRTETPMLVKLADEYKSRGLEIVGIALDQRDTEIIKKFVADYKIDYTILLPVPGSRLSQIDPVPTTLLIDAQGRLAKKYVGALSEKILRGDLEEMTKGIIPKSQTNKKRVLRVLHTNAPRSSDKNKAEQSGKVKTNRGNEQWEKEQAN